MTAQVHDHPARGRIEPSIMPFNTEAEQGLLGAILCAPATMEKVADFLRAEHFYMPAHQRIYAAIESLTVQGRYADPTMLKSMFDSDADLTHLGGSAYLADLASSVVTILNAEDYARTIFDLHVRRELIWMAKETEAAASDMDVDIPATKLIEAAESKLYDLAERGQQASTAHNWTSVLNQVAKGADAAYRRDGKLIGVTTGLRDLDKRLGGLVPSDLVILAGRPGMGKSALAGGIMWRAAEKGIPCLFFSLEMSAEQIGQRIAAAEAGLSADAVRKGEVSDTQFRSFMEALKRLNGLPITIDDRAAASLAYIRSQARRMKRRGGLGLIVVDYLQLIGSPSKRRSDNRTNEVSEITQGLKAIAKELAVPVLALSQLSRAVEQREDKRPQLSDLRESGSIEQDADEVLFVYREHYYVEKDEPVRRKDEADTKLNDRMAAWQTHLGACANLAEVIIGKNRHGPTGVVRVHFDGPTTTFSDHTAYYDAGRML